MPIKRARDDQERHPEQEINQEVLALGFLSAGDGRGEKQRRADPGQADPDDRRLDVDVAQEVEGQEIVDRDPVEARAIIIGMRHDGAGRDLHQKQSCDHEKILADPPLARRQRPEGRQYGVHRRVVGIVQEELVDEQHDAEGEEGEAEADPGPTEGVGGGGVADQRLKGPVLGPGPCHARPPRNRRERGEHQKIRGLLGELRGKAVGRRPARSRIGDVERLGEVVTHTNDGGPNRRRQHDLRLRQIDALQIALHDRGRCGLLVRGERCEYLPGRRQGDIVLRLRAQPHQSRGGVILAIVGAHAVEAAIVHQVGFLETALARYDVVVSHEHRTVGAHEAGGLRWCQAVRRRRRPGEQREGDNGDDQQHPFEHIADGIFDRRIDAFGGQRHSFHLPFSVRFGLLLKPVWSDVSVGCVRASKD